ncbi:MAG TPA: hypothetical protein VF466_04430 [Candidatus Saccharimonadales bacterium]
MVHDFVVVCGFLSSALAIYCGIPYILSILRGQTKPHQFTWLIFTIMNGIIVVSQFLAGARASMLISAIFLVYSAVEWGLSFKYGVRNSSRYDKLLLGLALATIALWALTRNNALAIWLTVLIDIFATTMLILKLKKHPGSEPFWLWFIATMAFVFSCLSLADKPFGILYVRPLYGVLSDAAVLAAILYFRPKGKKAAKPQPDFPEVV